VAALTGPQEWLSAQQSKFEAKRDQTLDALAAMGFKAVMPKAALYVWVDVRASGLSSDRFAAFAMREARVRVTPGTEFGAAVEGYVRVSLAGSREQLAVGMERLHEAIGGLKR